MERIDFRSIERHRAVTLVRVATGVLLLPLILTSAVVTAGYLQLEPVLRRMPLLLGFSAALIALGIGLLVRARKHFAQDQHTGRTAEQWEWGAGRLHRG